MLDILKAKHLSKGKALFFKLRNLLDKRAKLDMRLTKVIASLLSALVTHKSLVTI